MGRAILAVIGGYFAMFFFVFCTFTIAYFILGTSGSFKEGSFEVSGIWIGISFPLGFLGAIIGGFLAAKIAKRPGPLYFLAGLAVVLGLVQAFMTIGMEDPGPRDASLGNLEAMMQAQTPTWVAFSNVVVGLVGLIVGGRMALGSTPPPTAPPPPSA